MFGGAGSANRGLLEDIVLHLGDKLAHPGARSKVGPSRRHLAATWRQAGAEKPPRRAKRATNSTKMKEKQ